MEKIKFDAQGNMQDKITSSQLELNGCSVIVTAGNDKGNTTLIRGLIDRLQGIIPSIIVKKGSDHMIEHVHKHIVGELQQNARTDIIFIITAILLNLVALGINSGVSFDAKEDTSLFIVMFIVVALIIVVNLIVVIGLLKGKQTRGKLIGGLLKMYKDQNVAGYYDESLLVNYNTKYNLFILVVVFIGAMAIAIPFIIM